MCKGSEKFNLQLEKKVDRGRSEMTKGLGISRQANTQTSLLSSPIQP